jgi:hypothetical protein
VTSTARVGLVTGLRNLLLLLVVLVMPRWFGDSDEDEPEEPPEDPNEDEVNPWRNNVRGTWGQDWAEYLRKHHISEAGLIKERHAGKTKTTKGKKKTKRAKWWSLKRSQSA